MLLYQILVFTIHGKTKNSYNSNKFKIYAPTWSDEFELPDGSCSISDIQEYFEHIFKKHNENVDNPSLKIYVKKLKIGLHLKLKKDIILNF